jgi:hypothetical protein
MNVKLERKLSLLHATAINMIDMVGIGPFVVLSVVAQIMGHKPSATAEKHYTVRPLDLLRVHHEKIETWILEQAGVTVDAKAAPNALRVVQTA